MSQPLQSEETETDDAVDPSHGPQRDRSLPASPVAVRLLLWAATTGDNITTIARGFDLPERLVESLPSEGHSRLGFDEASLICRRLRVDPTELWGVLWTNSEGAPEKWTIDPLFGESVDSEAWPIGLSGFDLPPLH